MAMRYSTENEPDWRARAARLTAEAMGRDVEGQRELITDRILGRTDAVCRVLSEPGTKEWDEEAHRLREQLQCSLLRLHLTTEKIWVEIARAKALLGTN